MALIKWTIANSDNKELLYYQVTFSHRTDYSTVITQKARSLRQGILQWFEDSF
ncbi:MAG: hypothetical protein AAGA16_05705 [Cyanobacteria bacterium P01_E01_bin.35]